jgi:hypothetical protein
MDRRAGHRVGRYVRQGRALSEIILGISSNDVILALNPNTTTMKSKKNLTRFNYETAAFEGWRLCLSKAGTTFTRYFPDKKFGDGKKSLAAAEKTLAELKALIEGSKRVDGKLSPSTIRKGEKLLADAV